MRQRKQKKKNFTSLKELRYLYAKIFNFVIFKEKYEFIKNNRGERRCKCTPAKCNF